MTRFKPLFGAEQVVGWPPFHLVCSADLARSTDDPGVFVVWVREVSGVPEYEPWPINVVFTNLTVLGLELLAQEQAVSYAEPTSASATSDRAQRFKEWKALTRRVADEWPYAAHWAHRMRALVEGVDRVEGDVRACFTRWPTTRLKDLQRRSSLAFWASEQLRFGCHQLSGANRLFAPIPTLEEFLPDVMAKFAPELVSTFPIDSLRRRQDRLQDKIKAGREVTLMALMLRDALLFGPFLRDGRPNRPTEIRPTEIR